MEMGIICCAGKTPAIQYAAKYLHSMGFRVTHSLVPETRHLILDIPSFNPDGNLRSGEDKTSFFPMIPPGATVYGGNLGNHIPAHLSAVDLLRQEDYLAENAAITADCALKTALPHLPNVIWNTPTLVIGWGRIGKCLAALLKNMGTPVSVAARSPRDRAMLNAMGYCAVDTNFENGLGAFQLIFNTAPAPVLTQAQLSRCHNCVKIDLASTQGMMGEDVIWARGLPGVLAPEASGILIGKTVLKLCEENA